jgi:PilZ domain
MPSVPITERRQNRRRKPPQLVYLEFGRENGGMIKDVSDGGMRFHLMNPVAAGQSLQFAVAIDAKRRFEGQARMVWTDGSGKSGGLCFVELSAPSREVLDSWLAEMDEAEGNFVPVGAPVAAAAEPVAPSMAAAPIMKMAERLWPAPVAIAQVPAEAREEAPVAVALAIPPLAVPPPLEVTPAISAVPPAPAISVASQLLPGTPPAITTPEPKAELLEVGSQFIASPVPREVWQRAAREEIAPGERSRRPLAAAKTKAMREEVLAYSRASAPAETTNGHSEPAEAKIPDALPVEAKVSETLDPSADPLRDFLKRPIGGADFSDAAATRDIEAPSEADDFSEPRNVGWTTTRLAMVLALAAICGVAAAFAAIAYRQNVGESLIKLGEKISGEPRPAGNAVPDPSTAAPAPATDGESRAADKAANAKKRTGETPPDPGGGSSPAPAKNPPITEQIEPPPAAVRPQISQQAPSQSGAAQPQLAAGREVVAGKPRRPPEDVASLWIAVENGDTSAEIVLANHYAAGDGVDKNCDQARVLLQAAAKHGSAAATARLAQLAATGCE